jgi:pyruvate, water dikinase
LPISIRVGGKNASLGEMVRKPHLGSRTRTRRLRTTAAAYRRFVTDGGLAEMINTELAALDAEDVEQLAAIGRRIRDAMIRQPLPAKSGS